jgi:uncharacterized phage-associated protein
MVTIFDVANYFRWHVDYEAGDNITQLKLQKLCYYAQAWHIAFTGNAMFEAEFEAWDHGPANRELYTFYRPRLERGWDPIDPEDIQETFSPAGVFSLIELETLQEVWETYGDYGAKRLEELTHQETPWLETPRNAIISVEQMGEFYSAMLANNE